MSAVERDYVSHRKYASTDPSFIAFDIGFEIGEIWSSKIGSKSATQKVRLRAVWMGRNLGVEIGSFLGSKIRVIFRVDFWALFCPQKAP